jgi:uncharacterized Zn-binding protein involved in type VI secretion
MQMRQAAAKAGDRIIAIDTHVVLVPIGNVLVPIPLLHPFDGIINDALSSNVSIMGKSAATVDSVANNRRPHVPTQPGTRFHKEPANKGTIAAGSGSVRINGKPAARNADVAVTCNDPADVPIGTVIAGGSVLIG